LKRKFYEVDQLKTGINALEERLALAAQENEGLRKKLNSGSQSTSKLTQDYELKIRQLTSEKEQITRRVQEVEARLTSLSQ
jgi:chromosome segregation ATPase